MLWSLISWLIVGAIAGYVADKIMGTGNSSLGQNIILGIVGSLVGGILAWILGLGARSMIGSIIIAILGACVAVWVYRKIKK